MPELHLSFSLSPILVLLLSASAAGFAVWAYRVTVPPVPRSVRWLLMFLRSAAFLCVILIIAKPVISARWTSVERPNILLLVDNSQSMAIRDRTGDRASVVRQLLVSPALRQLGSSAELHTLRFDRTARTVSTPASDSLIFDGAVTDIAEALRIARDHAKTTNVCAAVLITDGNPTDGANPIYNAIALGAPVFTIGVGDSVRQNDVILQRVATNTIAYAKSRIPFRVSVRQKGFTGRTIKITLREGRVPIADAMLQMTEDAGERTTTLVAIPESEGRHTYTVEIAPLSGEFTQANNRMEASVNVLRSKMNLLLITGGPNPDAAFIRRVLDGDENVALRAFTEVPSGGFVEGAVTKDVVNAADAIILVGYPRSGSSRALIGQIREAAGSGKGLLLVFSRTIDVNGLTELAPVLPVSLANVQTAELSVFAEVPDVRAGHAILKMTDGISVREAWRKLPPVFRWQSGVTAKPEADVVAFARFGATTLSEPLIAVRNMNGTRSIAITGYSLWRWQMYGDVPAGTDRVWPAFIANAMRWLTTHDDNRRIQVRPARDSWTTAEPIEFIGQVYDETYRPVNDASIIVTVTNDGTTRTVNLDLDENGRYSGVIDPVTEGSYSYSSNIKINGTSTEGERGTLRVGPTAVEYLETTMNKDLLQHIALRTGGRYLDALEIDRLSAFITALPGYTSRERIRTSETELWNIWWMMAAAIVCIAAEWTLRKRMGMV